MKKQIKVSMAVSAAMLLAAGLSMTSFAASRGTWVLEGGEWYCLNRSGEVYEDTFCIAEDGEYYVGEDGKLVRSSWVEYENEQYYVNSGGKKVTNEWRYLTPFDDEEEDPYWYYFQSKGKMASNQKVTYQGKQYFLDKDGQMLTGWVGYDDNGCWSEEHAVDGEKTYFCGEDGARLESVWKKLYEPGKEEDSDAELYWYYFEKDGNPVTNEKRLDINGQTFIFGADGHMLTGWVANLSTGSDADYREIDGGQNGTGMVRTLDTLQGHEVFFCWYDEEVGADGHAQKNTWIKTWCPEDYAAYGADTDFDQYWYWISKTGVVYIPEVTEDFLWATARYELEEGTYHDKSAGFAVAKKKIGNDEYLFNQNGEMLSQFIEIGSEIYYLGEEDDGVLKTGKVVVEDDCKELYTFLFGTTNSSSQNEKKYAGVSGNKDDKLYYKGRLIQAEENKYELVSMYLGGDYGDYYYFLVDRNGNIQHGFKEYKEGGEVLFDTSEKDSNGERIVNYLDTKAEYLAEGAGIAVKYAVDPNTFHVSSYRAINAYEYAFEN